MSTFVAFGGFATLVMASFGGSRRDKGRAYLGLALAGSVLLTVGTAVSWSVSLAAVVTVPVAFAVLFSGICGPNAAAAATAALLAYVLPAASPAGIGTVPSRLAGWWLAAVSAAASVVLTSRRGAADQLRAAAASSAAAIADELDAAIRGEEGDACRAARAQAKRALVAANTQTPYHPTGLTASDQALAKVVEVLEWSTDLLTDSHSEDRSFADAAEVDRRLLQQSGRLFGEVAALLRGRGGPSELDCLERLRAKSAANLHRLDPDGPSFERMARASFHARALASAAQSAATDAMILTGQADRATIASARRGWFGKDGGSGTKASRFAALQAAATVVTGHASLRSVWFQSSARGAVALAAAVAVADLSSVQHAFWVVLGTLSVLRTNAVSTGATALRALAGTLAGFMVGAALILAIGTKAAALWAIFPVAVLVASYVPGTASFAAGQAAFTVVVSVLFNLLVPVGWKVGVIRVEDVAIGCAVSLGVGVLFWPRGAAQVVRDDLADAFRHGGAYLAEATAWALGQLGEPPRGGLAAVTAAMRLDDALRGFLGEQGAKRVRREDLWRLVGGALRLRLTASSLAGLPDPLNDPDPLRAALVGDADRLARWYGRLAIELSGRAKSPPDALGLDDLVGPDVGGPTAQGPAEARLALLGTQGLAEPRRQQRDVDGPRRGSVRVLSCTLWVRDHLAHLRQNLPALVGPAEALGRTGRTPWWR